LTETRRVAVRADANKKKTRRDVLAMRTDRGGLPDVAAAIARQNPTASIVTAAMTVNA